MKAFGFKKTVFLILLGAFLSIPLLGKTATLPNPSRWDTVEETIQGIIDFIFWLAVAFVPLMIIISAFYFLTSAGSPERIRTAKNIITYTGIGFSIILLAKALVSVVNSIIGG